MRFDLEDPWIKKAYELAVNLHRGQVDKSGKPYIDHLIEVANQVEGRDAIMVALLHDAMEDQGVTTKFLMNQDFPTNVIEAIILLTKTGDDYMSYILKIKENPLARVVKIADMRHNSDLSRLKSISEKDIERKEKYTKSIQLLSD
ncbi:MAG: GTP pyrophosphokinase [Firmicutes bacterium HGW-Firmicutes-20]|nr:MAG: GTP pyrophosphokinase [Firmicutes bacterium HGW-Firmicutes-20]PKM86181.1 MAG: GTP pyrophosphokinase [Firmicutes bacterium HGW-Firmicutes-10]